jgi:predicted ATP-grasp superfamily ATP-dependent carboligase
MAGLSINRRPELREPALIVAFAGWNDAGEAASAAVRWLVRRLPARRFASIDAEAYHVFTTTRPTVKLDENKERRITWPPHDLFEHADPEKPRDLALLVAREPELRWRTYCETVVELAREIEAAMLVSLGAFLADTPHSREVPVTGFATTDELRARLDGLGLGMSNYEGATGITGVLHDFARKAGLPSASLWAAVPQYLPTTPNPKAALALVRTLTTFLELDLDLSRLEQAAGFFQRQVDQAIARDRRATGYVRGLEQRAAQDPAAQSDQPAPDLPSAEEVIRDLEDFLRAGGEEEGS